MPPSTLSTTKAMFNDIRRIIAIIVLAAFITTSVKNPAYAQMAPQVPHMPMPGVMGHLSP